MPRRSASRSSGSIRTPEAAEAERPGGVVHLTRRGPGLNRRRNPGGGNGHRV
jgi:hypothetical protein